MIVSLAGLFLVDSTTIRSMAMGAIIVVAVSILAAVTLLPALMSLLGRRAYARGRMAMVVGLVVRGWCARAAAGPARPADARRRPLLGALDRDGHAPAVVSAPASAAVLLALAIPALSLDFGDGALRQFPEGNETRVGAELAARRLGPGRGRADAGGRRRCDDGARRRRQPRGARSYAAELRRDPEVARGRAGRSRRATARAA